MSFFKNFGKLTYDFTVQGETTTVKYGVTNILSRIRIYASNYKKSGAVDVYTISDGDTPEIVSEKYYGIPDYHYIILIMNDMVNGLEDFPKSQQMLEQFLITKYGEDYINDIHHYEDSEGNEVNSIIDGSSLKVFDPVTMAWNSFPISNYIAITNRAYEESINENKRHIYLVKAEYIPGIEKEIARLLAD
jgi:hypothetical protein